MDTILSSLSVSLLAFVEDQLSNNDVSSDDELLEHFVASGLTEVQARHALTYRDLPHRPGRLHAGPHGCAGAALQPTQPAVRAGLNHRPTQACIPLR
jgi:hypothetical protein